MKCKQCGLCCKWIQVGTSAKTNPNLDWDFIKARHIITVEHGPLYIFYAISPCPHLTDDNRCDIHDNKPDTCRRFPESDIAAPPGCAYWDEENEENSDTADIQ